MRRAKSFSFIDELHTIVGAGAAEGSVDASNMLKPMLARGELRPSGRPQSMNTASISRKTQALEATFPAGAGERTERRRHNRDPARVKRSDTKSTTACVSLMEHCCGSRAVASLHHGSLSAGQGNRLGR